MKKDDMLEKKFSEYFDSVDLPDGVTDDAKQYMRNRGKPRRKFSFAVKLASLFACAVIVTVGAVEIGMSVNQQRINNANTTVYYDDVNLNKTVAEANTLAQDERLNFLDTFIDADNMTMNCMTYRSTDNGELLLVKTELQLLTGNSREDTVIYAELSDNKFYAPLKEYRNLSAVATSYNYEYSYTSSITNGEYTTKAYLEINGTRYYIQTRSHEKDTHLKYISILINN